MIGLPSLAALDRSASTRIWLATVPADNGPRIGLFWQGTQVDPNRAIELQDLIPLWQAAPTARFISLQKGAGEEEIGRFKLPILAAGHELLDFSDTAGLLQNLDLLITIDTAVAHAAGALGRRAWVLLPRRPDWRWLTERTDSPWYPTLKLYRQQERGQWSQTIADIANGLESFARESFTREEHEIVC